MLSCRSVLAVILFFCFGSTMFAAGSARSRNFVVSAPNRQIATEIAQAAEQYRKQLAEHWFGHELAPWPTVCPINVEMGAHLPASGETNYFQNPVRDFQMVVRGSYERIIDSVLPHEVNHTVMATYFGEPLPRWADEGICTTVEHVSERRNHERYLRQFLKTRRGIAMNRLFLMRDYPDDMLPLYAQGYSTCSFLIAQKGPRTFIAFLKDYMRQGSWTENVRKHYEYESLAELQEHWLAWVADGSGDVDRFVKNATTLPATNPADKAQVLVATNRSTDPPSLSMTNTMVGEASIVGRGTLPAAMLP
ncbi:MAG: hypothetical protein AAFN70_06390, partial [Planctomycetota bacterium]